jgi:hypothetical protein
MHCEIHSTLPLHRISVSYVTRRRIVTASDLAHVVFRISKCTNMLVIPASAFWLCNARSQGRGDCVWNSARV